MPENRDIKERTTSPLLARVRAALLSGVDTLFVGRTYRHFRKTCEGVRPGESIDAVRKRLEAAGGQHWQADNIQRWQRARGLTFKIGVCTVEVDDGGVVQTSKFEEVDDLM